MLVTKYQKYLGTAVMLFFPHLDVMLYVTTYFFVMAFLADYLELLITSQGHSVISLHIFEHKFQSAMEQKIEQVFTAMEGRE